MKNDNEMRSHEQEESIISIIDKIKAGRVDSRSLPKENRQGCVEVLIGEGYTVPAIARVLSRSEKTIRRDLQEIRQRNALSPSVDLAKEVIGEMLQQARTHHAYLMRLARSQGASVAEKTQAESSAWQVLKELIERMQSLGYLPFRPQEILGEIFHHHELREERTYEELRTTITDVEKIANEAGCTSPEIQEEIKELKLLADKTEVEERAVALARKQKEENEKEEENERES